MSSSLSSSSSPIHVLLSPIFTKPSTEVPQLSSPIPSPAANSNPSLTFDFWHLETVRVFVEKLKKVIISDFMAIWNRANAENKDAALDAYQRGLKALAALDKQEQKVEARKLKKRDSNIEALMHVVFMEFQHKAFENHIDDIVLYTPSLARFYHRFRLHVAETIDIMNAKLLLHGNDAAVREMITECLRQTVFDLLMEKSEMRKIIKDATIAKKKRNADVIEKRKKAQSAQLQELIGFNEKKREITLATVPVPEPENSKPVPRTFTFATTEKDTKAEQEESREPKRPALTIQVNDTVIPVALETVLSPNPTNTVKDAPVAPATTQSPIPAVRDICPATSSPKPVIVQPATTTATTSSPKPVIVQPPATSATSSPKPVIVQQPPATATTSSPKPVIAQPPATATASPKPVVATVSVAASPKPVATVSATASPKPVVATVSATLSPKPVAATVSATLSPKPVAATVSAAASPKPVAATVSAAASPKPVAATASAAASPKPTTATASPKPVITQPPATTSPKPLASPNSIVINLASPQGKLITSLQAKAKEAVEEKPKSQPQKPNNDDDVDVDDESDGTVSDEDGEKDDNEASDGEDDAK